MKTPFPGMDQYLEEAGWWHPVHTRLVVEYSKQLAPRLRPRYVVSVEERVYVEGPEDEDQPRIPDIWVQQINNGGHGVLVMERTAAVPEVIEVAPDELKVRERFLEILDLQQDMKVVTIIEVLSPSNKLPGNGRKAYQEKQEQILSSESHLVEIDLLRIGYHTISVPRTRLRKFRHLPYRVCINRWPNRNRFEVDPFGLRNPLPTIKIPLAEPDPDVPLDLQSAFEQVYADGGYDLRIKYDESCVPPLPPEDQAWANECWQTYRAAHPELTALGAPAVSESNGR